MLCSPGIFQRFTASVKRMMVRLGFLLLVYLDDFLVIADTFEACTEAFNTLVELVQQLGFKINWANSSPMLPKTKLFGCSQ